MREYNIPADHVIMHHHVTGKLCPAMWTHNDAELEGWRKFQKMFSYDASKPVSTPATASDDGKLYYVQVGAFKSKENAENYLKEVQKIYPGAFIKKM